MVDLSLVTFPWPYPKNQELPLSESSMSCVQDLGLRSWMVAIIYAAFGLHLKGGAGGGCNNDNSVCLFLVPS